jgi:hypothetical protein
VSNANGKYFRQIFILCKALFLSFSYFSFLLYFRFDHFLEKDPDSTAQVNADLNCLGVKCSVADPDTGSGDFLAPGSGIQNG